VGRPDSTDPDIVASHVLGRWRQSEPEVRALVDAAAGAAERIVLGEAPL
jgi:peptidyl-tRNA hydrolase, PTH1 family